MHIVQAGFPLRRPAAEQPADRLLLNLLKSSNRLSTYPPKAGKYWTQPQSAERLFGWQDGSQGRAAKEKKVKGQKKRKVRTRQKHNFCESMFTCQKALGQHSTEFEIHPAGGIVQI